MNYTYDNIFENINYKENPLEKGEYDSCNFRNCNFSNVDLSEIIFIDCIFTSCNFSLVKLNQTAFREVSFNGCKMLGLQFETCNTFSLSFYFENCILNHSSFFKLKTRKIFFKGCELQEVDFTETDLTAAIISECNLLGAVFDNTNLERADFRTSYNYSINPEINRIRKAKFSQPEVLALLDKYDIEIG